MGIRIHKMLGYGLTDVKTKNFAISDKRFRANLSSEWPDFSLREYKDWVNDSKSISTLMTQSFPITNTSDYLDAGSCFVHDAEFGLSNVFCVVPRFNHQDWHRYDDIIDYTEQTYVSRQHNTVKVLKNGIYPYGPLFADSRTGKIVKNGMDYALVKNTVSDKDSLASRFGFESAEEADKYLRPAVPDCVKLLCEYAKIFVDPMTVHQLVPMLYTYWS